MFRGCLASVAATLLAGAAFTATAPQLVLAAGQGCVSPGIAGPNAALTGIVNSYYPATASAAAGSTTISVGARIPGASTAIAPDDLLLVIQMQDADIDGSNSIAYGDGATGRGSTALRSTGLYEYVAAASAVVGGVVTIRGTGAGGGLVNSYDFSNAVTATHGFRTFQVIRVPQYSSATVAAGLTAAAWDGTVHAGGVLAIDVAGGLNLNGQTISVDQLGFKGGLGVAQLGGPDAATDYVVASQRGDHGYKGEGIAGTPHFLYDAVAAAAVNNGADGYPSGDAARGAPGNAGGGGNDSNPVANDQNAGGGGGANGGQGGMGGNTWSGNQPVGGLGGAAFPAAATRVVLGGGGGAGDRNNSSGFMSSGGTGGGIVMIRTGSLSGVGTITANGGVGVTPANDGGGGGGAGGSVVVTTNAGTVNGLTVHADGGNGTDAWPAGPAGAANRHGPGGGGSGGVIVTSNALPPAQATVAGGVHGLTTNGPDAYGSTSGANGVVLTAAPAAIPGSSSGAQCVPVLAVTKITSTPAVVNGSSGTAATYTITVANAVNTADATNVTISDALHAGFTYASTGGVVLNGGATRPAIVNPAAGASTPAFGTFTIPGGGSVAITFTVKIAASVAPGRYSNPATGTYLDPRRTAVAGTTSAAYAGGGAERVTVTGPLPGLPNTSGPTGDAGVVDAPIPPPGAGSLALLAAVAAAGIIALSGAGRGRRRRAGGRHRGARRAAGVIAILLSAGLAPFQAVAGTAPLAHVTGVGSGSQLIAGRLVATTAPSPPPTPHADTFHNATGPIIPSRLIIPSIGVDAWVGSVGLGPDGAMGVPGNLWTASWLDTGPRPGSAGNAVIAGHRGVGSPALFSHLEKLRPGDRILVSDRSGAQIVYVVTGAAELGLSVSTQIEVFGPTRSQQLVLITCFGQYVDSARTYDHRLVVFARPVPAG